MAACQEKWTRTNWVSVEETFFFFFFLKYKFFQNWFLKFFSDFTLVSLPRSTPRSSVSNQSALHQINVEPRTYHIISDETMLVPVSELILCRPELRVYCADMWLALTFSSSNLPNCAVSFKLVMWFCHRLQCSLYVNKRLSMASFLVVFLLNHNNICFCNREEAERGFQQHTATH